jgi:hypothetical protein
VKLSHRKISGAAEAVVSSLILSTHKRKATRFLGDNLVVKLTRQRRERKNATHHTFLLTVGAPNYLEREFIKQCKKQRLGLPSGTLLLDFPVPRLAGKAKRGKKRK